MTTAERIALRAALQTAGFERTAYSPQDSTGGYTETWEHADQSTVTITWVNPPGTRPLPEHPAS